jgi:hypothetical protein
MAIVYNTNIVRSGLVLALDAANLKSYPGTGTAWNDLSGNGNNGTLVNGPTYSSNNNGSIAFDGITNYVDCGNNATLSVGNNITVNSWFYVGSISSYQAIVSKVPSDFSVGWEFANFNGNLRATLRPSATQFNAVGGAVSVGNWYMGTMTFDNTALRIYLNGVQSAIATVGGPVILNSSQSLQLGVRFNSDARYTGNISQASLYNRALTVAEITQNFNAQRGRFGI